jgi:TRAP-type C4-dicarboxylate transport system permease small subunit
MLQSFDRAVIRVTSIIVAALTATMVAVVIVGVFYRYALNDALPWTEELARFIMIWLVWLGGGLALRRGVHVSTDLVLKLLPPTSRRIVVFVGNVLIVFFLCICVYYGWNLVGRVSLQTTIALGVSMQVPYASVPVGAILILYHLIVVMVAPSLALPRDRDLRP